MATLGELATSLAHEINQPLAAIATNAQAAHRQLASAAIDPEIHEMLRDIGSDAQRAAQVIRRLRALFKKEHNERQPVDGNAPGHWGKRNGIYVVYLIRVAARWLCAQSGGRFELDGKSCRSGRFL